MGLSDFERELAQNKAHESSKKKRERSRSREREHRHRHRDREEREYPDKGKHHRSSRHDRDDDRDDRTSHKRSRHHRETSEERVRRKRRERERDDEYEERRSKRKERERREYASSDDEDRIGHKRKSRNKMFDEDESSDDEKKDMFLPEEIPDDDDDIELMGRDMVPPGEEELDEQLEEFEKKGLRRDDWMQAPSALDVDYVQRRKKEDKSHFVAGSATAGPALVLHDAELNHALRGEEKEEIKDELAQRDVPYTFGDSGAQWRITKLKGIYRTAEEEGRSVEEVALQKYGDLRDFDEAREEEIELERRAMYGEGYVGKQKPSGELFEERKLKAGIRRSPPRRESYDLPQAKVVPDPRPTTHTTPLDATALNKLKAQMMKAKLKGGANAAQLEDEYNAAMAKFANQKEPDVVVLGAMDNRMLAGGRKGEVKALTNKRGVERGLVVENDDMSIEDMIRQERRTKNQPGGEALLMAERIAKDGKFDNDLDYMDDNAASLAARAPKSEINLRNTAIADFQRTNRILDNCPLCHHEDKSPPQPPVAPIVSLATRVYLTLPTDPEISDGGAVITPIQHHTNLLSCDDDEWEEMRNFMKSLIRMYHSQGRSVVFYENAAHPNRKPHAALNAVPIPYELGDTAPAYFREAILQADEEWTQHKKIIDTLKGAKEGGMGRSAFRRMIAKEMPYFHVWFELDGGMGHVVEDERRWPRGDLFAREVLGGMLDADVEVVKRQGRWTKGDRRVDGFRKRWRRFDWTRVLEGQ